MICARARHRAGSGAAQETALAGIAWERAGNGPGVGASPNVRRPTLVQRPARGTAALIDRAGQRPAAGRRGHQPPLTLVGRAGRRQGRRSSTWRGRLAPAKIGTRIGTGPYGTTRGCRYRTAQAACRTWLKLKTRQDGLGRAGAIPGAFQARIMDKYWTEAPATRSNSLKRLASRRGFEPLLPP
jgi:hypothetical protein